MLGELSRELQLLTAKRDRLISEQHMRASGELLTASQTLAEQLAKAKGDDAVQLRLELRQAIRELIDGITVDIRRDKKYTYMRVDIRYRTGEIRRMILATIRGELKLLVADSEKWRTAHGKVIARIFAKDTISNLAEVETMLAGHEIEFEYDA